MLSPVYKSILFVQKNTLFLICFYIIITLTKYQGEKCDEIFDFC